MKNFFSKSLYLQGLRKVRTAGVAMAIVLIAINALVPIICMIESQMSFPGMNHTVSEVGANMAAPAGLGVILFAPILTYVMFSYLNERRASDFYHALPQKRVCVYTSFIAAIMTWIAGTLLASMLLNSILWACARWYDASVSVMIMSTLTYLITALVMVGFMVLAMTVTGTPVSNMLVFILFTLFVRAFGLFFLYGLSEIAPMFHAANSWLRVFDWEFFLPFRLIVELFDGESAAYYDAAMLIYWAVIGILLLVGAGAFYHYRKSENATKSAPNRLMQHIYRIAVTFPFMMLMMFMIIMDGGMDSYHLIFVVFAALVWIIYELLTTKKIKNAVRSLPLFIIPVLLSLGYVASVYAARSVVYNMTPEREDIVSVELYRPDSRHYANWEGVIIYNNTVSDPSILDMLPTAIEETKKTLYMTGQECREQGYINNDTVTITLKSGQKVTYNLKSRFGFYTAIGNSDELYDLIRTIPDDNMLESIHVNDISFRESANAVWAAFREDYAAMTEQQRSEYLRWNNSAHDVHAYAYIYGEYKNCYFNQEYHFDSRYTPKALELYYEYLNRENPPVKGLGKVREVITEVMEDPDSHTVSMEIVGNMNGTPSVYTEDIRVIYEFLETLKIDTHLSDFENAKYVYELCFYVDQDYSKEWYYYDGNGDPEATTVELKPMVTYYLNERFYVTLSEEDVENYFEIEKKYADQESNETTAVVVG